MQTTLTIRDATIVDRLGTEFTLSLAAEQVTVRELIRSRVYQAVKDHNLAGWERYRGPIQPTETERQLNGPRPRVVRRVDWEKQFDVAVDAFLHNGYLILVDERQVTHLDQVIEVCPSTLVTFLKLVPLAGG